MKSFSISFDEQELASLDKLYKVLLDEKWRREEGHQRVQALSSEDVEELFISWGS